MTEVPWPGKDSRLEECTLQRFLPSPIPGSQIKPSNQLPKQDTSAPGPH